MTSQIAFSTIDETYPVAGQDNNSQGFRDNFNLIKSALSTANSEITNLQNNTAKTNVDNDFNGVEIANGVLLNNTLGVQNLSSQPSNFTIDVQDADLFYGEVTTAADSIINFTNWPDAPKYRSIKIIINQSAGGIQKNLLFQGGAMRYLNVPSISGSRKVVVTADTQASYHFEVSSYNGGTTIFVHYLGQFVV